MKRLVFFLLFDGVQSIDFGGPLQVFTTANDELPQAHHYEIDLIGPFSERIHMHPNIPVIVKRPRELPNSINTLIVPGGPGVMNLLGNNDVANLVQALATRSKRVCSVCTGTFILADAGICDGLDVTTHWRSCDLLQSRYRNLTVKKDPIWVNSGNVWTSAGVTAGIDLALALVQADHGDALAQRVARRLVVYMRRAGQQSQDSVTLNLQAAEDFSSLIDWILENLAEPLPLEKLAQKAIMTPRTFYRKFVARTGMSPAKAVENLRLEAARNLLSTTALTVEVVASKVGFGTAHRLRRAFRRTYDLSPLESRKLNSCQK
ncbi:GlxA family transcriptional regulator [Brucella pseudogrignonensis]